MPTPRVAVTTLNAAPYAAILILHVRYLAHITETLLSIAQSGLSFLHLVHFTAALRTLLHSLS